MRWFCGISPKKVSEIITHIDDDAFLDQMIEDFDKLPKLNLLIEKISHPRKNVLDFGYLIIDIDQTYEGLSVNYIKNLINEDRIASGFTTVEDLKLIEEELRHLRLEIQKLINVETTKLSEDDYIEWTTLLAENCIDEQSYNQGVIIDDIISAYELKMAGKLESQTNAIYQKISYISDNVSKINLEKEVRVLINLVESYDKIAQPLQLSAKAKGIEHDTSKAVAREVRNLAVDLTNNHQQKKITALIIDSLKNVFSELEEVFQQLEQDATQVNEMLEEDAKFEEELTLMEEHNRENRSYSVTIEKAQLIIPKLCVCCMNPTDNSELRVASSTVEIGNKRYTSSSQMNVPICCQRRFENVVKWQLNFVDKWQKFFVCKITQKGACESFSVNRLSMTEFL